jgi:hypothetical protein
MHCIHPQPGYQPTAVRGGRGGGEGEGGPDLNNRDGEYSSQRCIGRCFYITVDSAMAASQNGFCSYKLSIHKKTNIMHIITKNMKIFTYLIFYHREIMNLDHFMTLSLSYANTVL